MFILKGMAYNSLADEKAGANLTTVRPEFKSSLRTPRDIPKKRTRVEKLWCA